jgi:tetratricopeptide (TPR) repeat protein
MPKALTQYRVFIGSPGGLEEERNRFRNVIEKHTANHSEPRGVTFHPVGWDYTLGGVGRPQELINEDLKQCDYAVFVLHDRWGSPTGSKHSSGTEEEWELAEELYKQTKIRNIALFFKQVEPRQMRDPGDQLKKVLEFKRRIELERKHLFKSYSDTDEFCDTLEGHLAKWLRDHEGAARSPSEGGVAGIGVPATGESAPVAPPTTAPPSFDYWITEASKLMDAEPEARDYPGVLFCAERATAAAASDVEWARGKISVGIAQFHLNKLAEAIAAFTEVAERPASAGDLDLPQRQALALYNKGVTLGQLGRGEEAIAVYDDVLARFDTAAELPLRDQVAWALFNKGVTLGQLGRGEEAIAVYDDVLARVGTAAELPLREQVARVLVNKGGTFGQLGRSEEEIAVYDDVLARFGTAAELPLREQVARALFNKGVRLGQIGRHDEAIAAYDQVLARFGTASELPLREPVAEALVNKGVTLGEFGLSEEAIAVYDDVLARFGTAAELPLREQVAGALLNKGVTLGQLGRSEEAIAVYDDVLARFGTAAEPTLREIAERTRRRRSELVKPKRISKPKSQRKRGRRG